MRHSFYYLIFIFIFVLESSLIAQPFFASREIGKILVEEPMVVVKRGDKAIEVKGLSMKLRQNDEVLTNEKGKASLLLSGGNKIYLAPLSDLYLTKTVMARYQYEYLLSIKGKLRAKIQPAKKRKIRLKTANALIAVKGTDFVVEFRDGVTQVGTIQGTVTLTSVKTKQSIEISKGVMTSVTPSGEILPPVKIKAELVKGLEHSGKTGFKELDKIINPPKEETVPGVESEREPFNPEEVRQEKRFGLGAGLEMGVYTGGFIFGDMNFASRFQLHYQHLISTHPDNTGSTSQAESQLKRTMDAVTFRYFKDDSGIFLGLGGGRSQFTQAFKTGSNSELIANGTFVLLEIGAQVYGLTEGDRFYIHTESQLLVYSTIEDNYSSLTSVDSSDYDTFTANAKKNIIFMLIGFGVSF